MKDKKLIIQTEIEDLSKKAEDAAKSIQEKVNSLFSAVRRRPEGRQSMMDVLAVMVALLELDAFLKDRLTKRALRKSRDWIAKVAKDCEHK